MAFILFLLAAALLFFGEVTGVDFDHVAWSLFLAFLGLAAESKTL